ncbi:hypothetical protein ACFQ08_04720 [Streptosporangium algeriense]|uniref:Helix-turn-helix domain-containing protein n=1 Tax=Streptosporangium algeriense TaxID=1682748 RepID=A0ABW3DIX7_9ACTN
MPPPIDPTTRAAILNDIRAGEKSCRGIARQHGVSDATVRKIAKDEQIVDAFSRAQTEKATRARTADMKTRRAELAETLLADVDRLRARAWSSYRYYERGPEGPELVVLDLPPLRETREAYTALGIAIDKHDKLIKMDSDNGASEARSMLGALAEGLRVAYEQLPADE